MIAIWTVVIMDTWSQQAINRRNLRNRTRYNEEIIRNFYDTMTTDYDIGEIYNLKLIITPIGRYFYNLDADS